MAPKDAQPSSLKDRIAIFSSDDPSSDHIPNVVRIGLNRKEGLFRPRKPISKSEKLNNRKEFIREKTESIRNIVSGMGTSNPISILPMDLETECPAVERTIEDEILDLPSSRDTNPGKATALVDSSELPPLFERSKVFETTDLPDSGGVGGSESNVPFKKFSRRASLSDRCKLFGGSIDEEPSAGVKAPGSTPNASDTKSRPLESRESIHSGTVKTAAVESKPSADEKKSGSMLGSGIPPRNASFEGSPYSSPQRTQSLERPPRLAIAPHVKPSTPEPSCLPSTPMRRFVQRSSSFDSCTSKVSVMPENVFRRNPRRKSENRKAPKFTRSNIEAELIFSALKESFIFKHMSDRQLQPLVSAFEKKEYKKGGTIVEIGEKEVFLYVVQRGKVGLYDADGALAGTAKLGQTFGELVLISSGCVDFSAVAVDDTVVLRVDQQTVNNHLTESAEESEDTKVAFLKKLAFLKASSADDLSKLAKALTVRPFEKGELLVKKGGPAKDFFLVKEGKVRLKDYKVQSCEYEPVTLGPGQYFGEQAVVASAPQAANVVGRSVGVAYTISAEVFTKVLQKQFKQILKAQDPTKIAGVKAISYKQKPKLDSAQLTSLAGMITNKIYKEGKKIIKAGKEVEPALYLVREGTVVISSEDGDREVSDNGYFGFEACPVPTAPAYSVVCKTVCVLGILTLSQMQTIFDTTYLEIPKEEKLKEPERPVVDIKLDDLQRHQILGEGNFGQVWLSTEKGKKEPYALKIQSKFELLEEGQAETVVREKDIMMQLHHPFILKLVQTYQDTDFLYMLLEFAQGGELFSVIHSDEHDFLPEENTKFYACTIADALAYMHQRFIAYRDLKPENIVLDKNGYPVIIDYGYAKYVPENTFTLCGTPNYLSPEMITSRGHGCAVDDWALGVIVYECLTGSNPFFEEGMDQTTLYRSIVQDSFPDPSGCTYAATDFINQLLVKDPNERLGSTSSGIEGIFEHPWLMTVERADLRARKIAAPWVPQLTDALDTRNFDDWSDITDKTRQVYPLPKQADQAIFEGF